MTKTEGASANQRELVRGLDRVYASISHTELHASEHRAPSEASGPIDLIVRRFGLSAFERDVLLLCAGVELDARFADHHPTFALALAELPDAHWSAVTPSAPLRAWRLIDHTGPSVTAGAIRIDERILHFLADVNVLDERLRGFAEPIDPADGNAANESAVHETISHLQSERTVQITGADPGARRAIAVGAAAALGATAIRLRASDIPVTPDERSTLARLVAREALLANVIPVIDAGGDTDAARVATLIAFIEDLDARCVVLATEEIHSLGTGIASVAIATTSRIAARPRLEGLAQRIEPKATWDDLVLPDAPLRALRELATHVRQRDRVYNEWGFADKSSRGLGISALFAGSSGTGKTMAAEVLARELNMDLYRVDLASVVSKYIGETEKNLNTVFSSAEHSDVVLLFDEADALFGKRTEVRDSHDRYANVEISYLLQRMESYQGLAILTTNMKQSLDPAFLRRLRFVIQFPFPTAEHRAEIWKGMFPPQTPTAPLEYSRLSQLSLAGGNIRNVALGGAFLAADRDESVSMAHLAEAARSEYAKLERPLSDAESRGWA